MVVADAESPGPVRKKARLSLKKASNDSASSTPSSSVPAKEEPLVAKDVSEELTDKDTSVHIDSNTSLNGDTVVPAVASLENLGNTCFLNSVLQVLRFTPGFLDRLDDLYQELVQTEKLKKQEVEKQDEEDADQYKPPQTCELVKFLHKLYRSMERQEEVHPEGATTDVMSMALKPERILNVIRELNPMFEGCLQHDAQELLRCILCYLQDAEKEILKLKDSLPPALQTQSSKPINPIMQNFLAAGKVKGHFPKGDNSCKIEKVDHDLFHGSTTSLDVNFSKSDILEQIDESETAMTGGGIETVSPLKMPECQIADVPGTDQENTRKSNCLNIKRSRKRPTKSEKLNEKLFESENNVPCETNNSGINIKCESLLDNQPSILSMLKGSASCKRLGMRGAVRKPKVNSNNNSNKLVETGMFEDSIASFTTGGSQISCGKGETTCNGSLITGKDLSDKFDTESSCKQAIENDIDFKQSSLKKLANVQIDSTKNTKVKNGLLTNSPLKCGLLNLKNSPLKSGIPVVKLENCDHVCDSPKKSVSAAFATKTLSPVKTKLSSSKKLSAITKLDFCDKKQPVHENETIVKKKDFVEKLFMGNLMLRTKCTECEFSREKIEEFHDISVAVRKEKEDKSDDEGEEKDVEKSVNDDEEEKGPSLPKLMESFSEVETLRGDNKYYCDKCQHLVEAQRSLHFNVLPDILSVHLKRFSTASGLFGYVSKINDHVRIPLSLSCLRHKCPRPCSRSDHRYRLYALIAHAGVTLTSGHYLAYVRVSNNCIQEAQQSGSQSSSKSAENCLSAFNSQSQRALSGSPSTPQGGTLSKFVVTPSQKYGDCWLECDDESIKVFSEEKFCSMLKGEDGSLLGTPYVLFYYRQNMI